MPSINPNSNTAYDQIPKDKNPDHQRAALLAIIVLAAGAFVWNHQPPAVAPVAQKPVDPAATVIHRVNDEELFALLEGMPVALMKLPNGDSRLLVIDQSSSP